MNVLPNVELLYSRVNRVRNLGQCECITHKLLKCSLTEINSKEIFSIFLSFSVKRNEFEKRRKMHYNEFDAVRRARQLIEEEDDDDSEGESSRTQCNNYQDNNLDDNTMDVDDNNKQSTSSALGH